MKDQNKFTKKSMYVIYLKYVSAQLTEQASSIDFQNYF